MYLFFLTKKELNENQKIYNDSRKHAELDGAFNSKNDWKHIKKIQNATPSVEK